MKYVLRANECFLHNFSEWRFHFKSLNKACTDVAIETIFEKEAIIWKKLVAGILSLVMYVTGLG